MIPRERSGRVPLDVQPDVRNNPICSDVNGDGMKELVLHVRLGDTTLGCASTTAAAEGMTRFGARVTGRDSVNMAWR